VRALRNGDDFVLRGDPQSLSDPLYVDDVIDALRAAAESSISGILDLCGGDPVPLRSQIDRVADALGQPPPKIAMDADPAETPIRYWSDPGRTIDALRLTTFASFTDGIQRYGREMGWIP